MEDLKSVEKLIEYFHRLPSIGRKSAERLAYAILEMDEESVNNFADALIEVKNKVHHCPKCGLYTEDKICEICSDNNRSSQELIVVSNPNDIIPFEKLQTFNGRYHSLNGVISPSKDIGPEKLNIDSLIERIKNEGVEEIILATDPTIEGETTALYLAKLIAPLNKKVSRLAYGLPMGGSLEYADPLTLIKSLEGRKKVE